MFLLVLSGFFQSWRGTRERTHGTICGDIVVGDKGSWMREIGGWVTMKGISVGAGRVVEKERRMRAEKKRIINKTVAHKRGRCLMERATSARKERETDKYSELITATMFRTLAPKDREEKR